MLCPKCKIGKLYIAKTKKDGTILKVKCIICGYKTKTISKLK